MSESFELKHPSFASFIAELQWRCMSEGFELKPCPFCGGSVTIGIGVVNSYFIVHVDWNESKCPIRMTNIIPDADTPEKAIDAWNRRASSAE